MRLTVSTAKKLSWNGDPNVERVYLYADGCVPTAGPAKMSAYLARLAVLANLSIKSSAR